MRNYIARQSIISCVSEPIPVAMEDIHLASDWQKRIVYADMNKQFPSFLGETEFEYLLIDLIDERFGVLSQKECFITASAPYMNSGLNDKLELQPVPLKANREKYRLACEQFVEIIAPYLEKKAVILHCAYWAENYWKGGELHPMDRLDKTKFNNELLQEKYSVLSECAGPGMLMLPYIEPVAWAEHKWGLAAFHYVEEYYVARFQQLKQIVGEE